MTSHRRPLLRALVVDFDGTLTDDGRPRDEVVDALSSARAAGRKVVLATGRSLEALARVWPDATGVFDAVVAENGAVITTADGMQLLADPPPEALVRAVRSAGLPFEQGAVVIGCRAAAAGVLVDVVHALGLDTQLVFNRGELMLLPAGVSKATGLSTALRSLGLSGHNAVAIGDAENDHAMLHACELAVAPSNAVAGLRASADLVLEQADGAGVVELISLLARDAALPVSERWTIEIGTRADGGVVELPAGGTSVLISGASGAGKSYLAGLVAEQLIDQGYGTLVIDPEGDHVGLRRLPNVVWLGGQHLPEDPRLLVDLVGRPLGNVVVDLSHLEPDARSAWVERLPGFLAEERLAFGSPHWVVIDEAHLVARDPALVEQLFAGGLSQYCFATFAADDLSDTLSSHLDAVVVVGADDPAASRFVGSLEARWSVDRDETDRLVAGSSGDDVVLLRPGHPVERCGTRPRHTGHLRHWHKYVEHEASSAFHFRRSEAELTGATATNLTELHDVLRTCDDAVVDHHCRHADFSRWIDEVVRDGRLARRVRAAEALVPTGLPVGLARAAIVAAIENRSRTF